MTKKRDNIQKELEDIAPLLSQMDRPSNQEVPDGYFEQLPDRIWQEIQTNEDRTHKSLMARLVKPRILAVAASLIVIIASVFLIRTNESLPDELWNDNEILVYLLENSDEIDEDILYSLIEEEDLMHFAESTEDDVLDYYLEKNLNELDDSFLEELF